MPQAVDTAAVPAELIELVDDGPNDLGSHPAQRPAVVAAVRVDGRLRSLVLCAGADDRVCELHADSDRIALDVGRAEVVGELS